MIHFAITGLLPISAVIATRNRPGPLARTLAGLAGQSAQLNELIIVDASGEEATRALCAALPPGIAGEVSYHQAVLPGAASQRNEGVIHANQPFILFLDDDILLDPDCIARLWAAMEKDARLGGVNATITNQQFHLPSRATRLLYRLLDSRRLASADYAGRVLGPGVNLLPADRAGLPEIVPVEWLNTTCTLYRREALPDPPFPARFTGYSLMEDLALSLVIGKTWKLANARTARIFHDSQSGTHKDDLAELARMELVNRHHVMSTVLGQRGWAAFLRLAVWEVFQIIIALRDGRGAAVLRGKLMGMRELLFSGEN